jgi:hypothetical protein
MHGDPWALDLAAKANIPDRAPDCFKCRHFKITWEPFYPRSCQFFCIKCRNLPSMEVFLSTGKHCFAFEARDIPDDTSSDI